MDEHPYRLLIVCLTLIFCVSVCAVLSAHDTDTRARLFEACVKAHPPSDCDHLRTMEARFGNE